MHGIKDLLVIALSVLGGLLPSSLLAKEHGDPLAVEWHHGAPNCQIALRDEAIQVFHLSPDTLILRQNICISPEAPFMYLLFGEQKALLLDTGDEADERIFPLQKTVKRLVQEHLKQTGQSSLALVVAHSHSHGDHTAADAQFKGRPNTTVLGLGKKAVQSFFHFKTWQDPSVSFDLGQRILDVVPIPGHLNDHIAIYDRNLGLVLSGDSLYPGRLYIEEGHWSEYKASMNRLNDFLKDKPVAYILGAHIEMSKTSGKDYPFGKLSHRKRFYNLAVRSYP
ncbi:MAG: MBL fold metallo-hydrolase [Proteobacteria bacterium]|nr:MBL fold metallo-hydrolase [Pseudomonadota bacterium]